MSGTVRAADPTATPAPGNNATIHVVQPGETVFHIAQMYGTTVDAIARANALRDPTQIQVGQRLLIPNTTTNPDPGSAQAAPASAALPGSPLTYTVQPGDSLFS